MVTDSESTVSVSDSVTRDAPETSRAWSIWTVTSASSVALVTEVPDSRSSVKRVAAHADVKRVDQVVVNAHGHGFGAPERDGHRLECARHLKVGEGRHLELLQRTTSPEPLSLAQAAPTRNMAADGAPRSHQALLIGAPLCALIGLASSSPMVSFVQPHSSKGSGGGGRRPPLRGVRGTREHRQVLAPVDELSL